MHRLSEEAIQQFLGSSLDPLCLATMDGRFAWVSPAWTTLLGFSAEELLSIPYLDLVHPDDLDRTVEAMGVLRQGESVRHFVNRYRHKDGSWRWLEWMSRPLGEDQVTCVVRDVTEREQQVAARERRVAQLLMAEEIAGIGHWVVDVTTGDVSWSPQVFEIHGRDRELGEPHLDDAIAYYHPDDRDRVQEMVGRAMETGRGFDFELRLVREDGRQRTVISRGQVETDSSGRATHIIGVFQDVTDARKVERRLRHAEKLASVGTLAASVAHEINNPLSYVQLNTVFLLEELGRSTALPPQKRDEVSDLLDDIRDGVERIQRIVSGLKGFAKARDADITSVPLGDVAQAALRLCRNEVEHVGTVRIVEPDGPLVVQADEGQLVQVVLNLLVNASHAMRPGVPLEIEVRVQRHEGGACIIVTDNGVGMSERVLARVTEPFFTTKSKEVGTGLGMFVSKGIAEAHGGHLEVRSVEGQGTTVTLSLPELEDHDVVSEDADYRIHAAATGRVLIVDDQLRVARSIARAIRPHGCDILTDPMAALELLQSERGAQYDVVLCDLMMPVLPGEKLYEAIPDRLKERFLFLSGGTFTADAESFAASVSERLVTKPPDRDVLRARVDGMVASRGTPD